MRAALALLAVLLVAALAPGSAHAAGCASVRVDKAGGGKLNVQVVRLGGVRCAKAQSLVRDYFHAMTTGGCGQLNNFCNISVDGWTCSIFPAGEAADVEGAFAGCAKSETKKIRMYKAGQTLPLQQFLSADGKVWCVLGRTTSCFGGRPDDADQSQRSATLRRDGTVTTCSVARSSLEDGCAQNWNFGASVLDSGRRAQSHGVRCRARGSAITCTLVSGRGKGKGFRITGTSVKEL
jgi:hypothetical protein